jgi:hypothetical protein
MKLWSNGVRALYGSIRVCNANGRWYGHTVMIMREVSEQEDTMTLRNNLRGLMVVRYGT